MLNVSVQQLRVFRDGIQEPKRIGQMLIEVIHAAFEPKPAKTAWKHGGQDAFEEGQLLDGHQDNGSPRPALR